MQPISFHQPISIPNPSWRIYALFERLYCSALVGEVWSGSLGSSARSRWTREHEPIVVRRSVRFPLNLTAFLYFNIQFSRSGETWSYFYQVKMTWPALSCAHVAYCSAFCTYFTRLDISVQCLNGWIQYSECYRPNDRQTHHMNDWRTNHLHRFMLLIRQRCREYTLIMPICSCTPQTIW